MKILSGQRWHRLDTIVVFLCGLMAKENPPA